jgi:hypothetical protein
MLLNRKCTCMQARYVQERRRTAATDKPHSSLLLDKPSLLLHPTPGPDAPNTELHVSEGGRFEQKKAENAFGKSITRSMKKRVCASPGGGGSLFGSRSPACDGGSLFGSRSPACDGFLFKKMGHSDLQFAGPALVLPEVHVQEDGTVHISSENLPEGWHACELRSSSL